MRQRYSTTPKKDPRPLYLQQMDYRRERGLPFSCPSILRAGIEANQFRCTDCKKFAPEAWEACHKGRDARTSHPT